MATPIKLQYLIKLSSQDGGAHEQYCGEPPSKRKSPTPIGGELIKINKYVGNSDFLSFELADIFKSMGVFYFSKKQKKTPISILIANDDANTTP